MKTSKTLFFAAFLGMVASFTSPSVTVAQPLKPPPPASEMELGEVQELARDILRLGTLERNSVIARLVERGNPDVVPALIQSLRFLQSNDPWTITAALQSLTGESLGGDWNKWMLWQEDHPEIAPFEGFAAYKEWVFTKIDPEFSLFINAGVPHTIRLEEITWGGVRKDGIPALVNPELVSAQDKVAGYLEDDELVFGVAINGDVRAYPLRVLDWHEMFNDVVGGVPVALAYCTLCGSGILFETAVEGRDTPFEFGSSGFLYRSNKLMYDRETNSLWNQFTGEPVVGALAGSGIALKIRPVAITSWQNWRAQNPQTRVLSLDTGHDRDYSLGKPYASYFNSPDLMFPALVKNTGLEPKDYLYALRLGSLEKAWSLALFADTPVLNDTIGARRVVLVGDPDSRTVRAYDAGETTFSAHISTTGILMADDQEWLITEDALVLQGTGSDERFARLPGHIAYWFAWQNFRPDADSRLE
jgi:hypothetical protein